jgi:GNAT superfamily N-acetyltransferase
LSAGYYTPAQTEAAIRFVFGVDSRLIADGTCFVALDGKQLVGCGGWSRRRTLYGGDQRPMGAGGELDPAVDAARIRAFFMAPGYARRGIGAQILRACVDAAVAAGFSRLELMSTLPGVPFYAKLGFTEVRPVTDTLPDGTTLNFVLMTGAARLNLG